MDTYYLAIHTCYYLTIKRNEQLIHTTIRTNHNVPTVKEARQKNYILHGPYLYKILESENQSEVVEIRLVIAWGWCGWGQGARTNKKSQEETFQVMNMPTLFTVVMI